MTQQTPPPASRFQRVLAYIVAALVVVSLVCIAAVLIGSALGGRDHTTILHGVRRHAEREGLPVPEWGFRARYWRGASERGA